MNVEVEGPADKGLTARAAALADNIRARAEKVDVQRFVDQETIEEMVDAGLFRGLQSAKFGGLETTPRDFYGAVIEISKACTASGWVLGILGVHPWQLAHMTAELQEEVYGDNPDRLVSSSYSPQGKATVVDGGFKLNGTWRSSSGVIHSEWIIVGALVVDSDRNVIEMRQFALPLKETTIVDDWYVLGMRGTGSRTVVIEDVFVPTHRTVSPEVLNTSLGPGLQLNTSPLFQLPFWSVFQSAGAGPVIGAARNFLEQISEIAKSYVRAMDRKALRDDELFKCRLVEATARLDEIESVTNAHYDQQFEAAVKGVVIGEKEQARSFYDLARPGGIAVSIATELFPYVGARVVYDSHPLQRVFRDILTMRQHLTQVPEVFYGAVADISLGAPGENMFLVPAHTAAKLRERVVNGFY